MMKVLKFIIKLLYRIPLGIILIFLLILAAQLFFTDVYNFPERSKFSGDVLFNPYANLDTNWYQCNFQTHAATHWGLTDGKQTGKEVLDIYYDMGYDFPFISDYFSINKYQNLEDSCFVPVYEHGFSIIKSHRLVFGQTDIDYFDVVLPLTTSDKQHMINRLHEDADMIAISHPKFQNGHREDEFPYLTGYELVEVLNHYRISDAHWDSALTAGRAAWIIGDDDSHNADDYNQTGVMWTMVNSNSCHKDSIITALKRGSAYSVHGYKGKNYFYLKRVNVDSMTVTWTLTDTVSKIELIGDKGITLKEVSDTNSVSYTFTDSDTYVRLKASIDYAKQDLYINPVIRYDGKGFPSNPNLATVNYPLTILKKFTIILFFVLVITFFNRKKIRAKLANK